MYLHFKSIAEKLGDFPIYLYDIPGRSVLKLSNQLLRRLSMISNIVGVKDATSNLASPMEVKLICGNDFYQLSGEDATYLAFLVNGGVGCISVAANVVPKFSAQIYNFWKNKDLEKSMKLNQKLYPLNKALFLETSPCPVKYALSKLKKCNNILRLPLTSITDSTKKQIDKALMDLNLL